MHWVESSSLSRVTPTGFNVVAISIDSSFVPGGVGASTVTMMELRSRRRRRGCRCNMVDVLLLSKVCSNYFVRVSPWSHSSVVAVVIVRAAMMAGCMLRKVVPTDPVPFVVVVLVFHHGFRSDNVPSSHQQNWRIFERLEAVTTNFPTTGPLA